MQIFEAVSLVFAVKRKRGARRQNAKLVYLHRIVETQTLQKRFDQERHLRSGRTAHKMQFVDDEEKVGVRIARQPIPRRLEDLVFDLSRQHGAQHRRVGDQDVRRRPLHVPSAHHLASIDRAEDEPGRIGRFLARRRSLPARFGVVLPRRVLIAFEPAHLLPKLGASARSPRFLAFVLRFPRMLFVPRDRR